MAFIDSRILSVPRDDTVIILMMAICTDGDRRQSLVQSAEQTIGNQAGAARILLETAAFSSAEFPMKN